MIVPIPCVHVGLGALIALIAIPLVLRKVPMNHAYGVRIPKAFVSDENWYEINAYGGKLLLGFGLFLLVFAVVGWDVAPPPRSPWVLVWLAAPLFVLAPLLALIYVFARRLPDR